ncbi:stress response protein nst1-like protein [Pochonia chlamydosporia 170]|uniref:Stress response protein NST1 n=1 Tax=Pochonia chlamydosporia 170 TaxID=1380566 RepID=A0A179FEP6_METCM|nr:stress response protein nst1-like protein [Pochonia chlamydosporia 170]OAQ64065.1 stress response protein nst1-like protein [Pochonia chlamydosporia 170]
MPATNQKPAPLTPASPRNTAKYTNKDGSKFITVPKSTPSDSSQPSTPTIAAKSTHPPPNHSNPDVPVQPVNRKKQKRRQKALAKAAAAELAANGLADPASTSQQPSRPSPEDQEAAFSDDEAEDALNGDLDGTGSNGHNDSTSKSKKNKKKKKKNVAGQGDADQSPAVSTSALQTAAQDSSRPSGMSRDKIWSTSNHEERERIKEFWLGLGEDERKSLVKVEKDAVLKKMKEQQKHTCSCSVCGRKRTAIEEELEGLYDAYYLELEQFANQGEGPPMLSPPARDFPPRPPPRLHSSYTPQQPSHGRIVEHVTDEDDDDELEEEVYSEDEVEDDEYSDDEPPEQFHNPYERDMTDFLTFGNSLQVKGTQLLESLLSVYGNMDLGGILTVADDLLKNDGKRFIEMMEQLAERRMAREEDAREHFSRGYGHPNGSYSTPHNHAPQDDDDYEDEEDEEEDYEDSQEEEYEDEEVYSNPSVMPSKFHTECCCQDPMTDEQRMEEGRRMFQIFAARMFEQRVLSAYKEKVAKERQDKLLEELEEEIRQVDQQKAKKAKNAQKKKDKAAQKKQALAEEKARKEAEKAAEEAARLESEQKRIAEQKQKAEEKRRLKESQKKAEEEARLRKEAERQRRLHEQREKQAEQERKAREAKEREKKLKEEQRQKEKQARDQREREAQERKEKQERDKREKEARAAKAQRESQEAAQRAKEDRANHNTNKSSAQAAQSAPSQPLQIPKRGQTHSAAPLPTVLPQHPPNPASYASPKIPVATPAIPKAPTPIRSRALSQQQDSGPGSSAASQSASVPSQNPSPHPGTPIQASPVPIGQERKASASSSIIGSQLNQPASPHSLQSRLPSHTPPFQMPPGMGLQPPPGLAQHRPQGFPSPISHEPMYPMGYRPGPNMMMAPPGLNGPGARGFPPGPMVPPGFNHASTDPFPMNQGFPMAKEGPVPTHTRQGSTGYDGGAGVPTQPIGRPAPIGRPGSLSQRPSRDEDEDTQHLGSSALVADDEPLLEGINPGSLRNQPPGPRGGFATSPFMDTGFSMAQNPWGPPAAAGQPFAPPGFPAPTWGSPSIPPGFPMGSPTPGMSTMSTMRSSSQPRHVTVRSAMCAVCRQMSESAVADTEGYIDLSMVKARVEIYANDASLTEPYLLNLCDTEGSNSNGGGTFEIKRDMGDTGKHRIRWSPDQGDTLGHHGHRAVGAPGEMCSPQTTRAPLQGH